MSLTNQLLLNKGWCKFDTYPTMAKTNKDKPLKGDHETNVFF